VKKKAPHSPLLKDLEEQRAPLVKKLRGSLLYPFKGDGLTDKEEAELKTLDAEIEKIHKKFAGIEVPFKERDEVLSYLFPTRVFLPILFLKKTTFHQWSTRGYYELAKPGSGYTNMLFGRELVYLAALVNLSNIGQPPGFVFNTLQRSIDNFLYEFIRHEVPQYRFCIAKAEINAGPSSIEWDLFDTANPEAHPANMLGKNSCWVTLDLHDISMKLCSSLYVRILQGVDW
jgi:hypothetical protein